jgi:Skp family chaperone for outer membrane proteins
MNKNIIRIVLIALVVLSATAVVYAAAPAKPVVSDKIGVVDYQKLWADYDLTKSYASDFEALKNKRQATLERWDRNRLLTEAQLKELDTLYEKTAQTDADKARIKALEDEATKLDGDLKALQAKKDLSTDESKQLADFQAASKKMDDLLSKQADLFQKELTDTDAQWTKKVEDNLTAAVAKVAEQKSFSVVLMKSAVLYGGTDLTASVLEVANKQK